MDKMMSSQMYREHILDLYKNPRNFGSLKNATNQNRGNNSLCGDEMDMQLIVKDGKIKDVKFSGVGCAISIASASMLTDKIKDMDVESVKKLKKDDILKMMRIPVSPVRLKCALLSLDTIIGALKNEHT